VPLISSPNVRDIEISQAQHAQDIRRVVAADLRQKAPRAQLHASGRSDRHRCVIEEDTLPPLGNFMVGIFVREDFNVTDVRPLVAALAAVARSEACVTDRALA
jgi:uncharacterized Fe-S cluster-containing radical SAM superfamily enzyme